LYSVHIDIATVVYLFGSHEMRGSRERIVFGSSHKNSGFASVKRACSDILKKFSIFCRDDKLSGFLDGT